MIVLALGSAGVIALSAFEEDDSFCASCHTAPEVTYYNRAYLALDHPQDTLPDLSTLHYLAAQQTGSQFKCIDCHQGDRGVVHRVQTLMLGARDTIIFLVGRDDPTIEKHRTPFGWLPDAACVACHTETLLRFDGTNNHFHTTLPQARDLLARGEPLTYGESIQRAIDDAKQNGITLTFGVETVDAPLFCADCHQPHKTQPENARRYFMDAELRDTACVLCHTAAQRGPQVADELGGR